MSEFLDSSTFGNKIYDKFPEMYKRDDKLNDYYLKRYIDSAGEGFRVSIDEINNITNLRDSEKVNKEFLPIIYSNHGLDIFNGIPETFLRNLVPVLNPLYSRKGSMSTIEYLCSVVSGIVCNVDVTHFLDNNRVDVRIDMDSVVEQDFPDVEQLRRIVTEFIPFYCNVSLVFTYIFKDTLKIQLIEGDNLDVIHSSGYVDLSISMDDIVEDTIDSEYEEGGGLDRELYENCCFLNSPLLYLTNNIFLNSINGYDTITVGGNTTIKTYSL